MKEENYNRSQNSVQIDDEIDLIELFKVLWSNKTLIVAITFIFTLLAAVYLMLATPWFKATALVEVGYYLDQDKITRLEDSSRIVEGLKFKYIDLEKNLLDKNATVQNISVVKNDKNFFTIEVLAKDNTLAIDKVNQIVNSAANNTESILNNYIRKQQISLSNVEREINFLKNNTIKTVVDQIDYIKNVTVGLLDKNIDYVANSQLPRIENKINYIKDDILVKIKSNLSDLENSIKVKEDEIKEKQEILKNYEALAQNSQNLNEENKDTDEALKVILVRQDILNYKNALINSISDLNAQFQDLLINKNNYENKIYNVEIKDLVDLQDKRDRLAQVDLDKLRAEKDTIFTTKLPELERKLINLQSEELNKLLDRKALVELRLEPSSYKNTSLISEIMVSQSAAKPKKKIVLVVGFMLGFMFSVFFVFVKDAVVKYKKENKNSKL